MTGATDIILFGLKLSKLPFHILITFQQDWSFISLVKRANGSPNVAKKGLAINITNVN